MKKLFPLLLAFVSLLSVSCFQKKISLEKIWETSADLKMAESVMYHREKDILYVSCINGKPTEKNGRGYLARVNLEGKILEKKWITGINAPKGMGIFQERLFVTDIDRVHEIDIEKGKIVKKYSVPEARFLNDIAIDNRGNVYVSDMVTSKIYKIAAGKIAAWLTLRQPRANGLLMEKGKLLVGTGQGIVAVNISDKSGKIVVPHDDNIDGLKAYAPGSYLITDWRGKTQVIGKIKQVLMNTTPQKINAADFEYIPEKKLFLIPTFFHHRVTAWRLK